MNSDELIAKWERQVEFYDMRNKGYMLDANYGYVKPKFFNKASHPRLEIIGSYKELYKYRG